jgi:uncharacterized delta-60 repeat protein
MRHRTHTFLAAALVALASVGAGAATAPAAGGGRPGTVDRSFGNGGRAYSDLPPAYDFGTFTHLAEAPGGALVDSVEVNYPQFTGGLEEVAIQRRLPDGSLDPSFGDGGSVSLEAGPNTEAGPSTLAVDPSGRVLYTADGTVDRLEPDGSVDAGFHAPASIHVGFEPEQIAPAPEGDIIVAGLYQLPAPKDISPKEGIAVARLNPDGSLDQSFGTDGVVASPHLASSRAATVDGVAALPDGSVLLLAEDAVFRYGPDGSPDAAFGKESSVTLPERFFGSPSLLDYPDGGFAVAEAAPSAGGGQGTDYEVRRYGADGAPVPSFGEAGAARIDVREHDEPIELSAGPEGGLVLAGRSYVEKHDGPQLEQTPVAIRLDSSGRPVPGFGESGALAIQPSAPAGIETPELRVSSSVVSPSGRIALAGTYGDALLIVRGAAGESEPGFGAGASQVTQVASVDSTTTAVGLIATPSGRLFVSSSSNSARRTSAPALVGFGAGGKQVSLDPPGFAPLEVTGPIFADGPRHLLAFAQPPEPHYLARTDLFGAPDGGFGEGGKVLLPEGVAARGVVVERGGAIVVFGQARGHRMAVVRYTSTGRLDQSFGKGGITDIGLPRSWTTALAATVLPDGDLVLAGDAGRPAGNRFVALVRLLPDGRLDRSFGHEGRSLIRIGSNARATLLARAGGSLIVAGERFSKRDSKRAFALRVSTDGRRQRSLGHGGFLDASGIKRPIAILPSHRGIVLVGSLPQGGVVLRAFGPRHGTVDHRFGVEGTVQAAVRQGRFRFNPVAAARVRGGAIVVAGSSGNYTRRGSRIELIRFRG